MMLQKRFKRFSVDLHSIRQSITRYLGSVPQNSIQQDHERFYLIFCRGGGEKIEFCQQKVPQSLLKTGVFCIVDGCLKSITVFDQLNPGFPQSDVRIHKMLEFLAVDGQVFLGHDGPFICF